MSVISITDFKGMAPKYGADQLPKCYTVTASDVELDTGAAVPGYGIDVETDLGTAGIQSIFKVNGKWLSSTQDLDYCRSIQPGDDKHTVYFCGKTQPLHYTDDDLVGSAGLLPEVSKLLGVPVIDLDHATYSVSSSAEIVINLAFLSKVASGTTATSTQFSCSFALSTFLGAAHTWPEQDLLNYLDGLRLHVISAESSLNEYVYISDVEITGSTSFACRLKTAQGIYIVENTAGSPPTVTYSSMDAGNFPGTDANPYMTPKLGASHLTGTSYAVTRVHVSGAESVPSRVVKSGVHGVMIRVFNLNNYDSVNYPYPLSEYPFIRLYRDTGEGFLFVQEQSVGAQQTDFFDDSERVIGAALSTQLNDLPIDGMHSLIALPNNILAGAYKNQLCFSRPGLPHAWPALWQVPVDGEIVGLGHFQNTVVVLTDRNAWMVNAYDPANASPEATNIGFGCVSKHGIVSHTDGVYYPSKKGLHRVYPGMARDDLVTKDIFDTLSWLYLYPEQFHAAIIDDKYKAITDTQVINIYLTRQFYTASSLFPVNQHPTAAIDNIVVTEYTLNFDFIPVDPEGDNLQWYVDTGDGGSYSGSNVASGVLIPVSHTYTSEDNYAVILRVGPVGGSLIQVDSTNIPINVNDAPTGAIDSLTNSVTEDYTVSAQITIDDADGDNIFYELRWGDGSTSSNNSPSNIYTVAHTYAGTDVQTVELRVAPVGGALVLADSQAITPAAALEHGHIGAVIIDNTSPVVGDALTGSLSGFNDVDGIVGGVLSWGLETSVGSGVYSEAATGATYLVPAGAEGLRILLTYQYTEFDGDARSPDSSATNAVTGVTPELIVAWDNPSIDTVTSYKAINRDLLLYPITISAAIYNSGSELLGSYVVVYPDATAFDGSGGNDWGDYITADGEYTVTLTTSLGGSDSASKVFDVNQMPSGVITSVEYGEFGDLSARVYFTLTDAENDNLDFLFEFGDADPDSESLDIPPGSYSKAHIYDSPGDYTVKIKVSPVGENNYVVADSEVITITVLVVPDLVVTWGSDNTTTTYEAINKDSLVYPLILTVKIYNPSSTLLHTAVTSYPSALAFGGGHDWDSYITSGGEYTVTLTTNHGGLASASKTFGNGILGNTYSSIEVTEWLNRKNTTMISEWNQIVTMAGHFKNNTVWIHGIQERLDWRPTAINNDTSPLRDGQGAVWDGFNHQATIVDCAWVSLIYEEDGDSVNASAYRDPVTNYLLSSAGASQLDFGDSNWMNISGYLRNDANHMDVAIWMSKWANAYGYIRPFITTTQQTTLDAWFLKIGTWCLTWVTTIRNKSYEGGDWFDDGQRKLFGNEAPYPDWPIYDGGPTLWQLGTRGMENRQLIAMGTVAHIGLLLSNTDFIAKSKLYFQHIVRDHMIGDLCDMAELHRSNQINGTKGPHYVAIFFMGMYRIADAVSRSGDNSLFTYATAAGTASLDDPSITSIATQPKSFKKAIDRWVSMVTRSPALYQDGHAGDSDYVLDFQHLSDTDGEYTNWTDAYGAMRWNQHYQDASLKAIYDWTDPGLPPKGSWPADEFQIDSAEHGPFYTEGWLPIIRKDMPVA